MPAAAPGRSSRSRPPSGAAARRVPAAVFLALIAASLAGISWGAERRIQVQGRILDPEGRGVEGQTVKLYKTRRGLSVGKFSSGGQIAEAARAETDENGYYEIDVPRDRSFDNFFMRFQDPATFDAVRYQAPPDREITLDLKAREPLRIDVSLQYAPGWEEVSKRLGEVGADSPRGKILSSLGMPEKEDRGVGPDGPRDEWWYFSRGVVYFFKDGEPAGFRRFEPVTAQDESREN